MSDNQNNTNNTNQNNAVKPSVHKLNLRVQRPQTEGYEKDETPIDSLKSLTTNSAATKPTLNLGATSYIPKSMGANTTETKPIANTGSASANITPVMSTSTPSFTPKVAFNPNAPVQPTPNMPVNQAYPAMGQSK